MASTVEKSPINPFTRALSNFIDLNMITYTLLQNSQLAQPKLITIVKLIQNRVKQREKHVFERKHGEIEDVLVLEHAHQHEKNDSQEAVDEHRLHLLHVVHWRLSPLATVMFDVH